MKLFKKIFISLGVAAASLGLGSCLDDLDLMPTNPSDFTADKFAAAPARYMDEVLANMYSAFATQGFSNDGKGPVTQLNPGFAVFSRAIFNLEEIPTDEACWLSANDLEFGQVQYGIPTAATEAVSGCYARLTANITLCNDFIRTVNDGYFFLNTPELEAKAKDYVRQAKILRSAAYFYLIDLFGNVPYADEGTDVGAVPAQRTRAEVYDLVVRTLEDLVAEYAAEQYPRAKYGFVGVDAAQALLVKFYLNAEVYTGTAQWSKCLSTAQALINRHKGAGFKNSGLCHDYHQNFAHNNNLYAIGGEGAVNEILWTIPAEDPQLLSYGGATILINAFLGSPTVGLNGNKATEDLGRVNSNNGWKCMVGREEFVRIFDWDATLSVSPDKRTRFWVTAKDHYNIENTTLATLDAYGNNGYVPVKFNNWYINDDGSLDPTEKDGGKSPNTQNQSGTDAFVMVYWVKWHPILIICLAGAAGWLIY